MEGQICQGMQGNLGLWPLMAGSIGLFPVATLSTSLAVGNVLEQPRLVTT